MGIKTRKKGNVNIVECSGTIKMGGTDVLLRQEMSRLLEAGERIFVLDMAKVPWMDTAGICELVASHKHVSEREGVIKVVVSKKVHDIFTITQLSRVFEICADVEEALGKLTG